MLRPDTFTERICEEVHKLPEPLAREVLDFIGYLMTKHGIADAAHTESLKWAQIPVMERIWDNAEDDVWNDM